MDFFDRFYMKNLYRFLGLGCIIASVAWIAPLHAVSYPEPRGYVSDFAGIIDPQTSAEIGQIARTIESQTSAEIAVVTINSLEGENLEYYANELFSQW
ncbi:MAG: TPM domain-containing protein, partial [Elusimicrobia bacterium]|nr:TPM domain-containing protein [Elusimicrobiota bacterium]MBD3412295.1 TPM domain-containing protein [Elusimicrobiota bacterium]